MESWPHISQEACVRGKSIQTFCNNQLANYFTFSKIFPPKKWSNSMSTSFGSFSGMNLKRKKKITLHFSMLSILIKNKENSRSYSHEHSLWYLQPSLTTPRYNHFQSARIDVRDSLFSPALHTSKWKNDDSFTITWSSTHRQEHQLQQRCHRLGEELDTINVFPSMERDHHNLGPFHHHNLLSKYFRLCCVRNCADTASWNTIELASFLMLLEEWFVMNMIFSLHA